MTKITIDEDVRHSADEGKIVYEKDHLRGLGQIVCSGCGEHALIELTDWPRSDTLHLIGCPRCARRLGAHCAGNLDVGSGR